MDHWYTAVRSLTNPQRHLCARTDHREAYACSVLILYVFLAVFRFPEPRSGLEVAKKPLRRAVSRGDKNPPRGFEHINLSFCCGLRAHLLTRHDMPQPSIQNGLSLLLIAAQWILLDGHTRSVADASEASHAQRLFCVVSAVTSVVDESRAE